MHTLIVGQTGSGKSFFAKQLVAAYQRRGISSIVLDPIDPDSWIRAGAAFGTSDTDSFVSTVKSSTRCMIFVDEAGVKIGRYNDEMFFLATIARHLGHISHFITQRGAQLSPTVRDQCSRLFMFKSSFADSKRLSDDWSCHDLSEAHDLGQYEFYFKHHFKPVRKLILKA